MSDTELVDWEQLSMIFGEEEDEEMDEEMAELFIEFIDDGKERLSFIKSAAFPADNDAISKEAHKFKGSASNFGFIALANVLGEIELRVDELSQEEYNDRLDKAAVMFVKSHEEVAVRYPALN